MDEGAAKDYLLKTDNHFRQLFDEHQQFERRLSEFSDKPFLSVDEQVEETVIKKKKLALKDQMQTLIHEVQIQKSVN
jgi:uncharacterized protein YdcH (DUF465 family)